MIETTQAYKVGSETFACLEDAQVAALDSALYGDTPTTPEVNSVLQQIVCKKSEVLAILTMNEPTPKTRKPRSDQGKPHRKKRTPAAEPAPIESTVEPSGKYTS